MPRIRKYLCWPVSFEESRQDFECLKEEVVPYEWGKEATMANAAVVFSHEFDYHMTSTSATHISVYDTIAANTNIFALSELKL